MALTSRRFWKFHSVAPKIAPATSKGAPPRATANSEAKYLAEPSEVDIGTDESALLWAEEHDPETAELLSAEREA
jgi:hypothetical protein